MLNRDDIEKLINNHSRRLQKLRERAALEGVSVDPKVLIEIEDIEAKLEDLRLQSQEIKKISAEFILLSQTTTSVDDQGKSGRGHVLISPLGLSPGAVTALYHALRDQEGISIDKVITISTTDTLVEQSAKVVKGWLSQQGVTYEPHSTRTSELLKELEVYRFARMVSRLIEEHRYTGDAVYVGVAAGRSSMAALASMAVWLSGAEGLYHLWIDRDIEERGDIRQFKDLTKSWQRKVLNPPFEEKGKQLYALVKLPLLNLNPLREQLVPLIQQERVPSFHSETKISTMVKEVHTLSNLHGFLNLLPGELTIEQLKQILELRQEMKKIETKSRQPNTNQAQLNKKAMQCLAKLTVILAQGAIEDQVEVERLQALVMTDSTAEKIIPQTLALKGIGTPWQKFTKFLRDYQQEIESGEKAVGMIAKLITLFAA